MIKRFLPRKNIDSLRADILELKPNNRYLIVFPEQMPDEEFDEIVKELTDALDLTNANTYVAIVNGKVNIIEFS